MMQKKVIVATGILDIMEMTTVIVGAIETILVVILTIEAKRLEQIF